MKDIKNNPQCIFGAIMVTISSVIIATSLFFTVSYFKRFSEERKIELAKEIKFREEELKETRELYEDTLRSIILIEHRLFTVMDTEIRILHYAIPHKEHILGCPECFKVKQEIEERQKDEEFVPDETK